MKILEKYLEQSHGNRKNKILKHFTNVPGKVDNDIVKAPETKSSSNVTSPPCQYSFSPVAEVDMNHIEEEYLNDEQAATVKCGQSQLQLLYIGRDDRMYDHFLDNFERCFLAADLVTAGRFLHQLFFQNKRLPDIIFVDISLNEPELKKFCARLKYNIVLNTIPIVYNEKKLSKDEIHKLVQVQLVDDIMAVDDTSINYYYSKVLFLKQSVLHNQIQSNKIYSITNHLPRKANQDGSFPLFLKRLVDIIVSLTGLIILSPIFLLISIIIKAESKGPVFYAALRAGKGFKVFKFYKFRSMKANADQYIESLLNQNQYSTNENGAKFFKINNDPRITRFGKFLRNASIDEIPQLVNVLKGDMSLVGNRPLPLYEAVTLTTDAFVERFSAPAGITGLWQVNKRGKAEMSTEERINLDISYSRNFTFLSDLRIMVKTPMAIFQKSDV